MQNVSSEFLAVGIDVSDRTAQVCVLARSGIMEEFKITLDEASLKVSVPVMDPSRGVVVLETGTRAAWIKRVLRAHGCRVVVADARKLAMVSKSTVKTDRNDARVLARLGLSDLMTGATTHTALLCDTYVRPLAHQEIYDQLKMRDQLVRRRGDLIREVRSVVKGRGLTLRRADAEAFCNLQAELPPELAVLLEPLFDSIAALTTAVRKFDARLAVIAKGLPEVVRLMQIPGVGPIVALAFFVVIGNPERFPSVRNVGAYLGLVVKRDQSGTADRALGISKAGNGFLRRLLMQSAQYILGPFGKDSALRAWGQGFVERTAERHSKKKARVAVARRLAVIMLSIWKNETSWLAYPARPLPTPEPVGSDDCAATPVPEHVEPEIAASPTDRTHSCTRRMTTRADESEGRRGGNGTVRASAAPGRNVSSSSGQGSAYPSSTPKVARSARPSAPRAGTPAGALPSGRRHVHAPAGRAGGTPAQRIDAESSATPTMEGSQDPGVNALDVGAAS